MLLLLPHLTPTTVRSAPVHHPVSILDPIPSIMSFPCPFTDWPGSRYPYSVIEGGGNLRRGPGRRPHRLRRAQPHFTGRHDGRNGRTFNQRCSTWGGNGFRPVLRTPVARRFFASRHDVRTTATVRDGDGSGGAETNLIGAGFHAASPRARLDAQKRHGHVQTRSDSRHRAGVSRTPGGP